MTAREWTKKFRDLAAEMDRDIGIAKVTIEKRLTCDYSDDLTPIAKEEMHVEITF